MDQVADQLLAARDHALAQRDALAAALRELVAIITNEGGYLTPERQAQLRHARALLAEHEGQR